MTEPYTPTRDEVRIRYTLAGKSVTYEPYAEFDRWLAAHDKEVLDKAESMIDGYLPWGQGSHEDYIEGIRAAFATLRGEGESK
jgi:hypothetical protein